MEEFKNCDFKKDRLDNILALYFTDSAKELWEVCKLIFTLSHRQSTIERDFSVNKEVLQDNLDEKSLISQRLVYDSLRSDSVLNVEEFVINQDIRRHCKLSSKRYKQDLEIKKQNSVSISRELKRKQKLEEIENFKRQKLSLTKTVNELRAAHEEELLKADGQQDMTCLAKAVSFLRTVKEKEAELNKLHQSESSLQQELRHI